MPKCFRDSVILMIPKPHKDTSCSENYRPISLASTVSKVIVLLKYENILASKPLQFGFKHGSSTSLCTSLIKQGILIEVLKFWAAFLMPARLLTWSIMAFYFANSLPIILLCHSHETP